MVAAALAFDARGPAPAAGAEPAAMAAAALLFFLYLGFEDIANMAEEVRDPSRDLPVALFISLAVTTALDIVVSFLPSLPSLRPPSSPPAKRRS